MSYLVTQDGIIWPREWGERPMLGPYNTLKEAERAAEGVRRGLWKSLQREFGPSEAQKPLQNAGLQQLSPKKEGKRPLGARLNAQAARQEAMQERLEDLEQNCARDIALLEASVAAIEENGKQPAPWATHEDVATLVRWRRAMETRYDKLADRVMKLELTLTRDNCPPLERLDAIEARLIDSSKNWCNSVAEVIVRVDALEECQRSLEANVGILMAERHAARD